MNNIKNLFYISTVQVVNYLFPIITVPIIARTFGPENVGIINYIAAIVGYFSLFVNYSFNYTGVRWLSRNPADKNVLFCGIFIVQLAIFIFCTILFSVVIYLFQDLQRYSLLCWVSYFSCIASLFTQNWFLQSFSNFKVIAIFSFITKLITFILIILFISDKNDLVLYSAILNVTTFLTSLTIFIYTFRKYEIKAIIPSFFFIKSLISDGKYLFLSSIVTNIYTTTGIVILGVLSTKLDVGYYTSAQKLMDVSKSIVLLPISQIIFPILARKFGEGKEQGLETVKKVLPIFIVISIMFLFFINIFDELIVMLLFGKEFLPIISLVRILSIGLFAVFFGVFIGGQVMLNLGMDSAFVRIQIIIAILSLFINCLLVRANGGLVTSIVWSISEVVISLYQVVYLYRRGVIIFSWDTLSYNSILGSIKYVLNKK
ncbi:oligosaccharide flippase family protein [Rosenbergiella sp. S61]|uniref:Oligosaccharide flippase family protein n=1 Tax=Rosenbergiella gaditana TaxID=2726987 RepID=A0ABS5SU86_9GAMM|nr:oligosaccharide flippase family protein [Rosenbergiella gaditana]MBT0723486.1 oligosaccharide flippase family protein [Rosenbergiella gaditana]